MAAKGHRGVPSTAHGQTIRRKLGLAARVAQGNPVQPVPSGGVANLRIGVDREIACDRRAFAGLNIGGNLHAGGGKVLCRARGIIIVAKDNHRLAGRDTVAVHIAAHRRGHHHAGPVIIGKSNAAL